MIHAGAIDLAMNRICPPPDEAGQRWLKQARPNQLPPPGDWYVWLLLAGRGFGKTRSVAEALDARVRAGQTSRQVLIAGRTPADVRVFCLEGPGGLLTHHPDIRHEPSKRQVVWPNGVVGIIRSGANPEEFRGYSGNTAWLDEFCAWDYPTEAWNNIMFGVRSHDPRVFISTTPKPLKVLKEIIAQPGTVVVRGSTMENRENLSPVFIKTVVEPRLGTRLGRQELEAEILEDVEGALWKLSLIESTRVRPEQVPELTRVAIGVDPQAKKQEGSETGIIAAGIGNGHLYILEDGSLNGSPGEWATRAVALYDRRRADVIAGEANNGGEMVEHTIRTIRMNVAYQMVWATRGKMTRAQPVASLYEQGRAHHVGRLAALEDEMTNWVPGAPSPNRMDAMVWAGVAIMPELGKKVGPVEVDSLTW